MSQFPGGFGTNQIPQWTTLYREPSLWVKTTSTANGSGAYAWVQLVQTTAGDGTWQADANGWVGSQATFPLYMANGATDVPSGTVVRAWLNSNGYLEGIAVVDASTGLSVRGSSGGTAYALPPNTVLQFGSNSETYTLVQLGTTVTVPDASYTTGGMVNAEAAQTIGGVKTFRNSGSGGAAKYANIYVLPVDTTKRASYGVYADNLSDVGFSIVGDQPGTDSSDVGFYGLVPQGTFGGTHGGVLLIADNASGTPTNVAYMIRDAGTIIYTGDYYTDSIGNIFKGGIHIGTTGGTGGGGGGGGGGTISRISKGTASTAGSAASSLSSSSISVAAGTLLIVVSAMPLYDGANPTATFAGNAMTLVEPGDSTSNPGAVDIFAWAAPADTTGVVTVTPATSQNIMFAMVQVLALVGNAADQVHENFGAASAPDAGTSGTTLHAHEYVQAGFMFTPSSSEVWAGTPTFTTGGQDVLMTVSAVTYRLVEGYAILAAVGTFDAALSSPATPTYWTGVESSFY